MTSPMCPICGNDLRIKKATVVVRDGSQDVTVHTSGSAATPLLSVLLGEKPRTMNSWSTSRQTVVTPLAKMLARPGQRRPAQLRATIIGVGLLFFGMIGVGALLPNRGEAWLSLFAILTCIWTALLIHGRAVDRIHLPAYEKAIDRWENSFWCELHDIVFEDGNPQVCAPREFQAWLWH